MDPNSQHQLWSLWHYRVFSDGTKKPDFLTVKANCARFGRLTMGSASKMSVRQALSQGRIFWDIKILSEGHPVHDPAYTEWMHEQWRRFFRNGFGEACEVEVHARLEAGDRQDGKPADQLIILPPLALNRNL